MVFQYKCAYVYMLDRFTLIFCLQNYGWGPHFKSTLRYAPLFSMLYSVSHTPGLELAKLADFPESVLEEGKRVAESLAALHAHDEAQSQTSKIATRRKALLRVCGHYLQLCSLELCSQPAPLGFCYLAQLRTQLTQAYEHSELPERELTEYLARLQKDIVKVLRETL